MVGGVPDRFVASKGSDTNWLVESAAVVNVILSFRHTLHVRRCFRVTSLLSLATRLVLFIPASMRTGNSHPQSYWNTRTFMGYARFRHGGRADFRSPLPLLYHSVIRLATDMATLPLVRDANRADSVRRSPGPPG